MPNKKRYAELDSQGQKKIRGIVIDCFKTMCSSDCIKEIDGLQKSINEYIFDIADSKVDAIIAEIKRENS